MDIIKLTRELGKEIQKDERYTKYSQAKNASDNDTALQGMIGDFNLKRMEINNEAQKAERDEARIQELNNELRSAYAQIMGNEKMVAFNEAKDEMDALLQRVSAIITQCAEGEDPETTDYEPSSCGGSCSSCAGCH